MNIKPPTICLVQLSLNQQMGVVGCVSIKLDEVANTSGDEPGVGS
jgi:hypothetical protein